VKADVPLPPVDIVKTETRHFACPQTEPNERRMMARSRRRRSPSHAAISRVISASGRNRGVDARRHPAALGIA
jgi:hypothetical protein